jgi:hypothetical protein
VRGKKKEERKGEKRRRGGKVKNDRKEKGKLKK